MTNKLKSVPLEDVSDNDLLEYYLDWEDSMIVAFGGSKRIRDKSTYSPEFKNVIDNRRNYTLTLNGKSPGFYQLMSYMEDRGLIKKQVKPEETVKVKESVVPSKPEFAKCGDCGGTFKAKELSSDYDHHNGWELPAYEQHICPVCPDGGNIDDYFDSVNDTVSPAELERLVVYVEEVGESLQAVGKVLRFGWDSTHPDGGPTNRQLLEKEIADVKLGIGLLDGSELGNHSGDIDPQAVNINMATKRKKLSSYLIHNQLKCLSD